MDSEKKVKFHTRHKFGKKRKKVKRSGQHETVTELASNADALADSEQHDRPSEQGPIESASEKKIKCFKRKADSDDSDDDGEIPFDADFEADVTPPRLNMIVNLGCLQSLVKKALCPGCKKKRRLTADEGGPSLRQGSACSLELRCTHCGSIATEMSSVRSSTANHNSYDVNRRIVASAVASGMGFTQTMNFFSLMGMPKPMSSRQWHNYKGTINTKAGEAVEEHLQEAVKEVRRTYVDRGLGMPDDDGVMDIVVSVDGSWQKRGHKSHNGVVAVVEHHTGLIIDSVALSNYCRHCNSAPKPDDPGFVAWQRNRQPHCQKNVDCASGAMEVEGALILFSRSVDKHKLRYTQMLGDGDAKTHARIEAGDPYEGRPVLKLECVNHVAKRLGTGLRDLKAKLGAQGQSIGGRGKLTDDRIKQLTGYYGRAIKDNVGDLDGMVAAVWASYFHVTSTDESHDHSLCPTGSDSWCFHQRATADGVTPRPHSKSLPADVAAAIRPLYVRLSDRTLLTRCLHGWTQNDNECFHSGLWSLCSKTKWAGLATVEMCLALAVQQFNKGASS